MNRIDLIIECLCSWKEVFPESWESSDELALTAALELKALHPVGTFAYDSENEIWEQLVPDEAGIDLYALDRSELPFKLSDAGADTNITRGLEPKGSGMVALHQPEQEPVGKIPSLAEMKKILNGEPIELAEREPAPVGITSKEHDGGCALFDDVILPDEKFLYTAPPRKPWVGLTDHQIALIHAYFPHPQGFARAIEAKSRELNG